MDYKERYEEAKKLYKTSNDDQKYVLESIFPELKESEGEESKKWILEYLYDGLRKSDEQFKGQFKTAIAWLEKHGKQEYALKSSKDKDVRNFMQQIKKEAKAYEFNLPNRDYDIYAFAKDILAWLEKQGEQNPYSGVSFKYNGNIWGMCARDNGVEILVDGEIKERVFLEKKELKKIEDKHTCPLDNSRSNVKFPFKAKVKSNGKIVTIYDGQLSADCKEWIKYQSDTEDGCRVYKSEDLELIYNIEQNPANWTEDDEIMKNQLIDFMLSGIDISKAPHGCIAWLKSLKDRIQSQSQWKPSSK